MEPLDPELLECDRLIPLTEAARRLPGRSKGGTAHYTTVLRWLHADLDNPAVPVLRHRKVGGRLYTCQRWIDEFIAAGDAEAKPTPKAAAIAKARLLAKHPHFAL